MLLMQHQIMNKFQWPLKTSKNASKKLLAVEFDGFGQFLPLTFEGHLEGAT